MGLVAKYEPRILEEIEKWNKELIHDLKSLAVDLLGDLIKIIIGIPDDEPLYDEPLMEVDSKVSDWFKKVWAQIKEAFDKLGAKIKETAEKLFPAEFRAKIAAMAKKYAKVIEEEVEEMVKKYEDLILDALTKDGKVIIAEAKKLLITTIDNIVERIVKIIHSVTVFEDTNEENGIKEMWELFKLMVKAEVDYIKG